MYYNIRVAFYHPCVYTRSPMYASTYTFFGTHNQTCEASIFDLKTNRSAVFDSKYYRIMNPWQSWRHPLLWNNCFGCLSRVDGCWIVENKRHATFNSAAAAETFANKLNFGADTSKILGGQIQIFGRKKVAKTDESMGVSQFVLGHPGFPQKSTPTPLKTHMQLCRSGIAKNSGGL